jgi:hypothetical protein
MAHGKLLPKQRDARMWLLDFKEPRKNETE